MTETPVTPSTDLLTRAQQATGAARKREGGEAFVFTIRDEVAELLTGSPFQVDSYLQNAYREMIYSPKLTKAARENPTTVLGAIMLGATLQLPIGGPLGQFYLTPRGQKDADENWTDVCVPMIGYRGFFELGYRSGRIGKFDYRIVREGDTFDEWSDSEVGNRYEWRGKPGGDIDRPLTGVIAIAKQLNGEVSYQYMSRMQIDNRKPRTTRNTPWEGKHVDAMYVKTVHRELAKYLQLTIHQALAVEADENIAQWNKATKAIQTVQDDTAEAPDENGAPRDEDAPPADEHVEAVVVGRDESPTPQRGAHGPERDPAEPSDEEWAAMQQEPPRP